MSTIVLSTKGSKLMTVCEAAGLAGLDHLKALPTADEKCPAICMTEGCDFIAPMEPNEREGYCDRCGGATMVSVLVLAGVALRRLRCG